MKTELREKLVRGGRVAGTSEGLAFALEVQKEYDSMMGVGLDPDELDAPRETAVVEPRVASNPLPYGNEPS
jgi:hypothetical protein